MFHVLEAASSSLQLSLSLQDEYTLKAHDDLVTSQAHTASWTSTHKEDFVDHSAQARYRTCLSMSHLDKQNTASSVSLNGIG